MRFGALPVLPRGPPQRTRAYPVAARLNPVREMGEGKSGVSSGRLSAWSGGRTIGYFFTRIDYDRQPNGNRPAMDRPRIVRDPISLAALQRNEGTVAIGLGADIVWVSALER